MLTRPLAAAAVLFAAGLAFNAAPAASAGDDFEDYLEDLRDAREDYFDDREDYFKDLRKAQRRAARRGYGYAPRSYYGSPVYTSPYGYGSPYRGGYGFGRNYGPGFGYGGGVYGNPYGGGYGYGRGFGRNPGGFGIYIR